MSVSRRPRRLGALLSILVAAVAVGFVASTSAQRVALAVGILGAVGLWGGFRYSKRSTIVGGMIAVLGLGVVLAGIGLGAVRTGSVRHAVEVVPGLLGIAVLAAGVAPLRIGRERLLIAMGTALVVLDVLASGAVRGVETVPILAAAAASLLAWDLAEQAVNLAEQVGEKATTRRAELVHGGATTGFAGLAVGATWFLRGFEVTGLPLFAVLLLLAGAVTLTLVLYN